MVHKENVFQYRDFFAEHNPNAKFFSRTTTPGLMRSETPVTNRLPNVAS